MGIMERIRPQLEGLRAATAPAVRPVDDWHEGGWVLPDLGKLPTAKGQTPASIGTDPIEPERLEAVLREYGISAEVQDVAYGPAVSTYLLSVPVGSKGSLLVSRQDDLARDLCSPGLRVLSTIPGTSYLGIEAVHGERNPVHFRDLMEGIPEGGLHIPLGVDSMGEQVNVDLSRMPHLLVAGTTGSGKSVFLNTVVCSLVTRLGPEKVKFLLVDPKQVEFAPYRGLPHLWKPIANTMEQADALLGSAVAEMERRMAQLSDAGMRNIESYNKWVRGAGKLEYLVCIVDEFSDLMLSGKELRKGFEEKVTRLAQKARFVGIHLILSTQKPTVNVVTGQIKGNMSSRISFRVASGVDSKVILDGPGAEKLLGAGDMLLCTEEYDMKRIQGAWLSDSSVKSLVFRR